MSINNIVVFAATSAIAESVLRIYAARQVSLVLVAKNAEKLAPIAADLEIRGAKKVDTIIINLDDLKLHDKLFADIIAFMPNPDLILIAHGVLRLQQHLDADSNAAMKNFHINANSPISLMMLSANILEHIASAEALKHLAVIGSVAGDVGRAKMTIYGAAKAAIEHVASGLAGRLRKKHVQVTLIKPGYIATPMTRHIANGVLMSTTIDTAPTIVKAIDSGKLVVYVPRWWQLIMLILKFLPRSVLYRLKI